MIITVSRTLTAMLLCTVAVSAAQAEEAKQGSSGSVIDQAGHAIQKGAKATADGAEFVAKKVVGGLETGARATGRALNSAADAVGIETGSHNQAPAKSTPKTTSSTDTNAHQ